MNSRKGTVFITTSAFAWTAVAVTLISTAVTAYGAYAQGENAKETADYNAKVEDIKAKDAANIGANQAGEARVRARKIMSAQAEGGAMSGVDISTGTPLGLLTETAGIGEKEALTIMNNAQRQAWGHQAQSELDKVSGDNAMRAGMINTASTVLNGASSTYGIGKKGNVW